MAGRDAWAGKQAAPDSGGVNEPPWALVRAQLPGERTVWAEPMTVGQMRDRLFTTWVRAVRSRLPPCEAPA